MPKKLLSSCSISGCPELTRERYCTKHQKEKQRKYDQKRGTSAQRGYGARWQRYRKMFLAQHPLCACDECKKRDVPLPANVVDHIKPHKGDHELFWNPDNHQPMNSQCHNRKTAQEDGGFGNWEGGGKSLQL